MDAGLGCDRGPRAREGWPRVRHLSCSWKPFVVLCWSGSSSDERLQYSECSSGDKDR